jgi:hypothetical protein
VPEFCGVFSSKVCQKSFSVALLVRQLSVARLQHSLKKSRDGITPPKIIFYKTRFEATLNRLLGMRVHPFYWTVQTYPSMTAPGKTTAFQEALLVMTNYNELNTLSSKFVSSQSVMVVTKITSTTCNN